MTSRRSRQSSPQCGRTLERAALLVAVAVALLGAAVLVPGGVDASQSAPVDSDVSPATTVDPDASHTASDAATTGAGGPSTAGGDAADATLTVSDGAVAPGEQTAVAVSLSEVPEGLAGFEVTLELGSSGVATVANASYPEQYGYATTPRVADDGQSVTLEAVDLHDEVQAGDRDVRLATVVVRGEDAGETDVAVSDLQVDADGGSRVEPALAPGTVEVTGASSGATDAAAQSTAAASTNPERGPDGPSPSGDRLEPWALGAVALVVLASLLAVVISRDR